MINWSEIDQANQAMFDILPNQWWGLYSACLEKGFTKEDSLRLVMTYIETTLRRLE